MLRNKDGTISLKLADFGLAMDVKEPIFTVCGTPTYVAPEILSEIGELINLYFNYDKINVNFFLLKLDFFNLFPLMQMFSLSLGFYL